MWRHKVEYLLSFQLAIWWRYIFHKVPTSRLAPPHDSKLVYVFFVLWFLPEKECEEEQQNCVPGESVMKVHGGRNLEEEMSKGMDAPATPDPGNVDTSPHTASECTPVLLKRFENGNPGKKWHGKWRILGFEK